MFKLYYAPGTCALASHIALAEAGAPYTTAKVDFKTNQQNSPEYLAINPKGRVPSLVTDHGILTETPAMLAFIAQSFPQAKLAPLDNAFAFAQDHNHLALLAMVGSEPFPCHHHRFGVVKERYRQDLQDSGIQSLGRLSGL